MLLTNPQKRAIAIHARQAWDALPRADQHAAGDFTAWRHAQQQAATGIPSLRQTPNESYLPLKLHFQIIANTGQTNPTDIQLPKPAIRTLGRIATDEQRRARWHLDKALRQADLPEAYAAKICRTQYRTPLQEATAKQLWHLTYTIRNRTKTRRAKTTTH